MGLGSMLMTVLMTLMMSKMMMLLLIVPSWGDEFA